jgi:branched-chain amino acid transport system permease protein
MAFKTREGAGAVIVVALLALTPVAINNSYMIGVLTVAMIYGLWAASWDFMSGLTGRENFGYALFIGAGAYTAGFLDTMYLVNPWWGLPAGIAVSVAFSVVLGLPTLRLKGPYFALAMLSSAAIMQRLMLIFWEKTGGEEGLYGIRPLFHSQRAYYYLVLAVTTISVLILVLIARSPWGIILRAIRGDETTCRASGINVTFYKLASLAISAAFGGLGGALYAHYQLQVSPQLFSIVTTITVIIMVYVGGMGSIFGAFGGAILLTVLTEQLRDFGEWRLLVYSLVLILILFFLPGGLIAPTWRRLMAFRR